FTLGGHALGTIGVATHAAAHRFDAEDLRVLTGLAEFTAAAVNTLASHDAATQAQEDLRQILKAEIAKHKQTDAARTEFMQQLINAKEAERHRIARELHDQMGQHLAALILGLKVLRDGMPESSPFRERQQEPADRLGK